VISSTKNPLAIYLLWHPEFDDGESLASLINKHFNDFGMTWSGRGESVPVRTRFKPWGFAADAPPRPIDLTRAETNLVVAFVEQRLLDAASQKWKIYLEDLREQVDRRGNRDRLLVMSLSKGTVYLKAWGENLQSVRVRELGMDWGSPAFETRLLSILTVACIRQLQGLSGRHPSKTAIFISHAKKDGDDAAKKFKDRLEGAVFGLEAFYDAIDLEPAKPFDKQFARRLKDSALLILETEHYHGRPWCEREALMAKQNRRPMLVVDMICDRVRRTSCHLGNAMLVRASKGDLTVDKIDGIILELVSEVMREAIWRRRTAEAVKNKKVVLSLRPPEACDALFYNERETIFLYPDPPAIEAQAAFFKRLRKFRAMTWAEWESRQQ
jgi:hypothetical protein